MKVWLEVRCCCQPQKLLGWLPVTRREMELRERVRFPVHSAGLRWRLDPESLGAPVATEHVPRRDVTLEVRDYSDAPLVVGPSGLSMERNTRRALSSEETPISDLRKISSFVESPAISTLF